MIRFSGILLGGVFMFALLATFWPSTVLANGHAGCVRSLGGQPIANAAVSLLRVLPDGKSECLSRVWSQSDGSYQLDGALPEPVQDLRLEAAEQEHLTSQQLLSCGLQDFDLVPLATIDGQMSALNGAAAPGLACRRPMLKIRSACSRPVRVGMDRSACASHLIVPI